MFGITDYIPQTTFWDDFTIAEAFGLDAIRDTYDKAFNEWKTNHIYLTELAMVLNWKCWHWVHYSDEISLLYSELFYKTDDYAWDNLKGEELEYYYHITD